MLKSVVAALAAVLIFAPTAASVQGTIPALPAQPAQPAPQVAAPTPVTRLALPAAPAWRAPTVAVAAPAAAVSPGHEDSHGHASLAPDQSRADYYAWLARSPANAQKVRSFRDYLAARGLENIVPVWQLIRTSSSWRQCGADRFEVAPADKWDNIVTTLAFVRDEVRPAVGEVEALSVYRNEALNRCSNGAPQSAHRLFFALDLTPVDAKVSRGSMIRGICSAHARNGRGYETGLGFYSGMRFHVDSSGFRKWGANGKGATSPCVTGNFA